jgi:hypothetical protein
MRSRGARIHGSASLGVLKHLAALERLLLLPPNLLLLTLLISRCHDYLFSLHSLQQNDRTGANIKVQHHDAPGRTKFHGRPVGFESHSLRQAPEPTWLVGPALSAGCGRVPSPPGAPMPG